MNKLELIRRKFGVPAKLRALVYVDGEYGRIIGAEGQRLKVKMGPRAGRGAVVKVEPNAANLEYGGRRERGRLVDIFFDSPGIPGPETHDGPSVRTTPDPSNAQENPPPDQGRRPFCLGILTEEAEVKEK